MAYLLNHTYINVPRFNASVLKGTDQLMLKQIVPFAKAYNFSLHLAQVTYTEIGRVTLDIGPFDFGPLVPRCVGHGHSDDNLDADDVEMEEVEETDLAFCAGLSVISTTSSRSRARRFWIRHTAAAGPAIDLCFHSSVALS